MKIGVIILAAGSSRRLGEPKQLLEFEGKTLLRRAAETALAANAQKVVVVLGANSKIFRNEIVDLPLQITINQNWAKGMSGSIRIGLQRLLEIEPDLSAIVLLLCDQPFVTTKTIRRLIEKYQETKKLVVASEYDETFGVPALFAREMFNELLALKGDAGARFLIKKQAASGLAKILAQEAAFDVDTRADYQLLLQQ
jgi:molybdenum cofactor cytidylyltransferase